MIFIHSIISIMSDTLFCKSSEPDLDAELVAQNQQMWVRRCWCMALLVTTLWATWIVIVQFVMPDAFPSGLFVKVPDQGEYTGW
jgi:hypothetical protein